MDYHFKGGVKRTEDHVISHPNDQKPARPVAAAQHEYPAQDGDNPDEANPSEIISKRVRCVELVDVLWQQVVEKRDAADRHEYPTDDRD